MEKPPRRKGAARMADIPPGVLQALNEGREETITLVEWLAVDMPTLLRSVVPHVGLADSHAELAQAADSLAEEGVRARMIGIGNALFDATDARSDREQVFEAIATYPSDMVRAWAAWMVNADANLALDERLQAARRFAADHNGAVRENAWDSFRAYVAADLADGIDLLEGWVYEADPNIRRCAIEGTRPRGVWAAHIGALKDDPGPGLKLLEPVRSDPSRYVQRAVANWLNDASKSRPDWVRRVCVRWTAASPTKETAWIIRQGLRTLRKKGEV